MGKLIVNIAAIAVTYYNVATSGIFTKNDCSSGFTGSLVSYNVAANTYSSIISQADADAQAASDVATNGQTYANAHGVCISNSLAGILLIDYYVDTDADLSLYCSTAGVTEQNQIVASTANGGPLIYPNDGRDPSLACLASSDKLSGPPVRRFGINMPYFINAYPSIDHFTFIMKGRSSSAKACSGIFALRDTSQGTMILGNYGGGLKIPGVSIASTPSVVSYSTNIVAGADGTVGTTIGSPILQLDYIVSTNTLTPTTF